MSFSEMPSLVAKNFAIRKLRGERIEGMDGKTPIGLLAELLDSVGKDYITEAAQANYNILDVMVWRMVPPDWKKHLKDNPPWWLGFVAQVPPDYSGEVVVEALRRERPDLAEITPPQWVAEAIAKFMQAMAEEEQ